MKISLIWIGKTVASYLSTGIDEYIRRLQFYTSFDVVEIAGLKNTKSLSMEQQRDKESELILKAIQPSDVVVLLDDKGRQFSSPEFANWIEQQKLLTNKHLVFVIGGAYGFSEALYKRANAFMSLSRLTYSHQMVRLIFLEQLYRAHTIIQGEPYHHEESLFGSVVGGKIK